MRGVGNGKRGNEGTILSSAQCKRRRKRCRRRTCFLVLKYGDHLLPYGPTRRKRRNTNSKEGIVTKFINVDIAMDGFCILRSLVFALGYKGTNLDLEVILSFVMQLPQKFSVGPYETHHAGAKIYYPKDNLKVLRERAVANHRFLQSTENCGSKTAQSVRTSLRRKFWHFDTDVVNICLAKAKIQPQFTFQNPILLCSTEERKKFPKLKAEILVKFMFLSTNYFSRGKSKSKRKKRITYGCM